MTYNYNKYGNNLSKKGHGRMRISIVWLTLVFSIVFLVNIANADQVYQVFLYYDQGKLYLDRDRDRKVIIEDSSIRNNEGEFRAEIIDKNNSVLSSINFEPKPEVCVDYPPSNRHLGGCRLEDQGSNAIQLPYSPVGVKIKIYDSNRKLVIEYDISYLANLASMSPSPVPSQIQQPISAPSTGVSWYLWVLIGLVLIALALFILRWRQRKKLTLQSPS